jgi:GDP-4-dehydro-6-deoxy-D-mannose reductase
MRVLIVGAAGFAGRHLARELLARGHEVIGGTRSGGSDEAPPARPDGRVWPDALPAIPLVRCDVRSPQGVAAALAEADPQAVFLLAGVAHPPLANRHPEIAFAVHVMGAVHVMTAVESRGLPTRVLLVTSSEVYGRVGPADLPVREETPLRPEGIYAASKAGADLAAAAFASARGLDVVRLRPFNHTGPGQRPEFVCPDFAAQIAGIVQGRRPARMEVGNLDVRRDFTDVRDVVRGYALALERGRAGEAYNLCSGRAVAIREILDTLCEVGGARPEVVVAAGRRRGPEVPVLYGSADKAAAQLGWRPEIPLRETLRDVLQRALDTPPATAGS